MSSLNLLPRQEYVPESEISGFRSLSESQQADVLYNDAIMLAYNFLDESTLSEKDAEEYHEAVNAINLSKSDADYQKAIRVLKQYPSITDYQIVAALSLNRGQIVKFLLRPYYNTNSDIKLLEAPKQDKDAESTKTKENSKPNVKENKDKSETNKLEKAETKVLQLPDKKQSEGKKEPKKQQQKVSATNNGKAAKNMTAMDIANAFSPEAKNKQQATKNKQHDPNCNCGHCHGNSNPQQQVQQQVPMSLEEKTKLLKECIDFSPVKGVKVKDWEIDNLLQFVNSPILKSKLKEYNSACNPEFPKLTICSRKYKFDKNLYKFAFYTPTNKSGKVLVVLYNTNATLVQGVGMTNEMGFIVVNESLVK